MKIDCHMHTPLCGHAIGHPLEYVRAAAEKGIELITFTCHIPMASDVFGGPGIRMDREALPEYIALVEEAATLGKSLGVEVLRGIEAEIFPDMTALEAMDELLRENDFDFVLGSLHHQLPSYRNYLREQDFVDDFEIVDRYFRDVTDGIRSGRYHSIAHPDVIRIYGTVTYFDPAAHEAVVRELLQAALDHDVCLEVNTSGLSKGVFEVHPDPLIMTWAAEMGVKLTIGSDSHQPGSVGQHFDYVLPLLMEKGFTELHYFRGGKRFAEAIQL